MMNMNMGSPEQQSFTESALEISPELILDNKESVTDFFGDNRQFYEKLSKGGSTYNKTLLTSQEGYDEDLNQDGIADGEQDLGPLDPRRITDARAESIAKFFREHKDAQEAFVKYHQWYTQNEGETAAA